MTELCVIQQGMRDVYRDACEHDSMGAFCFATEMLAGYELIGLVEDGRYGHCITYRQWFIGAVEEIVKFAREDGAKVLGKSARRLLADLIDYSPKPGTDVADLIVIDSVPGDLHVARVEMWLRLAY